MPYRIVKSENKYCVVNDRDEVKQCYRTRKEALRLMRALYANVPDARAKREDDGEKDEIYRRYHALVNMSASELERWAESPCSKLASLTRAPIKRNLHLLKTPKSEWGTKEMRWAKRTISFISRMRGMPRGEPVREGCPSARDISLMNWAYRPTASRGDVRAFEPPAEQRVACRRVSLEDVPDPRTFWVLAAPFNVVDAYNSFFSARTDWRPDLAPERAPVFDYHGLRGRPEDAQPIGRVLEWRVDDAGRWALVQLDESDPRAEAFMRAAASCELQASVGMLRAGMHPQPPASGVYDAPTELLQAPVVELSLIIPSESERAANPAAVGGYSFAERSANMEQTQSPPCAQDVESLRAQIEALRAEMNKLTEEKRKAEEMAMQERQMRRRDQMAQRMMQMQVPQSVINELLDVFGDVPEGAQDKLIDVVGRLVDTVRAAQAPQRRTEGDMRAVLVGQFLTAEQQQKQDADERLLQQDREWLARRFAQRA
ncbi:MAG: hypothetical protein ACK4JD_10855 [Thermoflexales bacterium]